MLRRKFTAHKNTSRRRNLSFADTKDETTGVLVHKRAYSHSGPDNNWVTFSLLLLLYDGKTQSSSCYDEGPAHKRNRKHGQRRSVLPGRNPY